MTRNGKIARLPLNIRRQLNQRLYDGQKARKLVQWLNGLPEVKAVLAADFNGEPIAEYNLSRWKNGGYRVWQEEQEAREAAVAMMQESPGLQDLAQEGLSKRMAFMLTAKLLMELRVVDSLRDGPVKTRRQRDLLNRYVALQRGDLEGKRLRLERRRLDFQERCSLEKDGGNKPASPTPT